MSTETPPPPASSSATPSATPNATVSAPSTPERVYVEIPRLKPGQGYKAPKNYQHPVFDALTRVLVVAMCAAMPLATAIIFFMILVYSNAIKYGFLWLWITMIIFIEAMALLIAYGVAREALGWSGGAAQRRDAR